jgi:Protein of unknown function (DUF3592)
VIVEPRPELSELQRRFVVPPGLNRGVPREVRLTTGGRVVYVAAVALLIAAVVAGLALNARGLREQNERRMLAESHAGADAEVVRLWRASNDRQKQPWVSYRFTVEGRAYEGQSRISLPTWQSLQVGGVLAVRYAPERPDVSRPAEIVGRALPLWVPYLAATPLVLGGLVCLFLVRAERWLLTNGRPAPAVVTRHRLHHSGHGGRRRTIAYDFPLLSGAVASGQSGSPRTTPAVGSVICVVYDPEHPRRSKPYPFQLVRASIE